MNTTRLPSFRLALPGLLACLLLWCAQASAQTPPPAPDQPQTLAGRDMQLIAKDAPITAMVGEEDGEGLWVVSSDGTSYSVWTPENVTLEALSAFQSAYKNKEVTLTGDVYKDRFGNLNLFVRSLP